MKEKITHKEVDLEFITSLFKTGLHKAKIIENPLHPTAYLIHSYIDTKLKVLHLFYHDPVNGFEVMEGNDILSVPTTRTSFKRDEVLK